ncbi:MAG: 5-(carboxyamino)imidazole ribonucleotide mutase [Rhodothermales bacterium]|nr:5-(carboxyamino)imidazole ribonucleotide mutase [Rhodothermales bacterium]
MNKENPLVAILMGSESDLPVMQGAVDILEEFGISFDIRVLSAHRTPEETAQYAADARDRGVKVFIAGAGGAAHLGGVIAAFTPLPVIGVPVPTKNLGGLDSLLSIVQMPSGVPVASVAIGGAKNAALLAVQIIGTGQPELLDRFMDYKAAMLDKVAAMNQRVQDAVR